MDDTGNNMQGTGVTQAQQPSEVDRLRDQVTQLANQLAQRSSKKKLPDPERFDGTSQACDGSVV